MLTEEQLRMVAQIMNQNPGISEQQAIQAVMGMPPGAMTGEGTQGVPQGPALGQVPGDVPQVNPGLMTPQGIQPRPQAPQSHPMCGPGTVFNGQQCVLGGQL
jgi:hypothetical protein